MYSKYYFEKYAQLTLGITEYGDSFTLDDKPDLQNAEKGIGIEVVNVETKEQGILRCIWNQYSGHGLSSNEFREKIRNPKLKQKVIPDCGFMAMEVRSGDTQELVDFTIEVIRDKSRKYENYKHFTKNGLYLYNHMFEEQIRNLHQKIILEKFPFDFYIINIMGKLYVLSGGIIREYEWSLEQGKFFGEQALAYEKSIIC